MDGVISWLLVALLFVATVGLIIRLFSIKSASRHACSEEELRLMLAQSLDNGEINPTKYAYVNNIFKFGARVAREIMVPRTEMVCLYADRSLEESLLTIRTEGFTRYPVAGEDKDRILGVVHAKELFIKYLEDSNLMLTDVMRPALFMNEAAPLEKLLEEMRERRTSMAILIDEYGGTAGVVTMEDILEEIVGEIHDEFDSHERSPVEEIGPYHYLLDNKVLLSEVAELTGVVPEEGFDTIGGWAAARIREVREGMYIEYAQWRFTIKKMEGLQIRWLEAKRIGMTEDRTEGA
ncbi:hemolysin family protein [Aneurinibacillus aneurinilyticus]|uniref:CBS domain protein n=1 Tax=Aneurinibacillus aneurinilyticus ATCC 12856 TaxID=649747 RepID=U1Y7G4_ANEAE|nr:hemolysin family protein [Aneurinibacillus aneurinilyticus]ERI08112.1 CBS domain protein [Aneurinibacillus aneurinilyticus ATCC 12856]MED0669083.1 hemolysin family protein [Aneurinibacillus aneurinilyticus]MED0706540.1 hemolysin family protein [Aneurinibacillus aneurinilyticus]MED0724395.1 hemolysin family protein [Aneurinibacillus aneurinilyticus]MED0730550.1 hemolysin family protein [Aneurinibacillus aneurinilyticus]